MHYYVIKDGRSISDFDTLEEARDFAKIVNGDIATETEQTPETIEE